VTPNEAFLGAFALHPAGVAVITGVTASGKPVGFTATSLTSFSAIPPRASFNMSQLASSYRALSVGSKVVLHFLAEDQVGVSARMSGPSNERFEGDHWVADDDGLPRLHGVRAMLTAHVVNVAEVGDNAAVIVQIDGGETNPDRRPLVYVERAFHSIGEVLES
jgi:flavin reductase (DIM6/NTAB) family NADH-FMN oxidoreductase RutF